MKTLYLLFLLAFSANLIGQDTFSIVAIDTITGEIGSAGASCIDENAIPGGAIIISDIIPGVGAIHTQAWYESVNQQNAHNRMLEGLSPQEIIDWLQLNDYENIPARRQYGVVDFSLETGPRSAAFTGASCSYYADHIAGPNYAIQGNILLDLQILDDMEYNFLNTEGMLAEKLMAALQGANVVGADSRCTNEGTSSKSAFIRVAQTSDTNGSLYLDLNVPSTAYGVEPIDSLQVLFNEWLLFLNLDENRNLVREFSVYPNPAENILQLKGFYLLPGEIATVEICNIYGQIKYSVKFDYEQEMIIQMANMDAGIYILSIKTQHGLAGSEKFIIK